LNKTSKRSSGFLRFTRNNGLSIVFVFLFILALGGQTLTGWKEYNKEQIREGYTGISLLRYFGSGHFIQATFENWESEFLQMALFVLLTVSLRQKGSSESKKISGEEEVDREPLNKRKNAPWPVRKGGWILYLYERSLGTALLLLFVISFWLHFYGSLKDENRQRLLEGKPAETFGHYLGDSRFWFESFQNWQSEFLSVFVIVLLSVFLRQKGSPQSKPVDAPHNETGE
jgi:hypothetical protein